MGGSRKGWRDRGGLPGRSRKEGEKRMSKDVPTMLDAGGQLK